MKTLLVGLACAFLALILAWGLIVLLRPETGIESAVAALEIAFVLGGVVGGLWSWKRRRRGQPIA